jgi:hypothetical protein
MSEILATRYAYMRRDPAKVPAVGDTLEVYYRVPDPAKSRDAYFCEDGIMTVTEIIYWGDNAIDVLGTLNNGHPAKYGFKAPSGDLC